MTATDVIPEDTLEAPRRTPTQTLIDALDDRTFKLFERKTGKKRLSSS